MRLAFWSAFEVTVQVLIIIIRGSSEHESQGTSLKPAFLKESAIASLSN
jgi:hypothetical protein